MIKLRKSQGNQKGTRAVRIEAPQQHKEAAAREAPLEVNPAVELKPECFREYLSFSL